MTSRLTICMLSALLLTACERYIPTSDDATATADATHNVVLRVAGFEQVPFSSQAPTGASSLTPQPTRAAQPISELCTRVSFAVYDGEQKVKVIHQKQGDASFGTATMQLPEGTYQVAVFAHNGESSVSVTSLDRMTANRRVTDTFYHYGEITVSGTEGSTHDVQLRRCVAMFRLVVTDEIPTEASYFWFQYKGGSSTLSAVTGYGSVNSTQTETRTIGSGQRQFDIYTFPHDEDGVLNITVRAFDANDNLLAEREFADVPVTRNRITRYTGAFFTSSTQGPASSHAFQLTADGEWDGATDYYF